MAIRPSERRLAISGIEIRAPDVPLICSSYVCRVVWRLIGSHFTPVLDLEDSLNPLKYLMPLPTARSRSDAPVPCENEPGTGGPTLRGVLAHRATGDPLRE